jgi:serine/threonine-protein kinase
MASGLLSSRIARGTWGSFGNSADGTGIVERLTKPEKGTAHFPDSWSRDGQLLSFTAVQGGTSSVWTFSLRDKKVAPIANAPSFSGWSMFSPDGRWLAYQTTELGNVRIYVRPFPATATNYQISKSLGASPLWSPDGKELFFTTVPNNVVAVSVRTEPSFSFSGPVPVPKWALTAFGIGVRPYDILPDGRFIGVVPDGPTQAGAPTTPQIRWCSTGSKT